jgi:hypothetical protein
VTLSISFRSIPILIDGHDTEGLLTLFDGQLVAVLSRLDGEIHDLDLKGSRHLEAGFGPCQGAGGLFKTPEEIADWATQEISKRSSGAVK